MNEPFLESLSRPQPNPGGGAAAAYGARIGLALLEKIVRIELNRNAGIPPKESFWKNLLTAVTRLSDAFAELQEEDVKAYLRLSEARARASGAREKGAALREATECPIKIMEHAGKAQELSFEAAKYCRKHLLSDLLVVCELLSATGLGAYHIVRANLTLIDDAIERSDYMKRLGHRLGLVRKSSSKVKEEILIRLKESN